MRCTHLNQKRHGCVDGCVLNMETVDPSRASPQQASPGGLVLLRLQHMQSVDCFCSSGARADDDLWKKQGHGGQSVLYLHGGFTEQREPEGRRLW